MEKRRGRLAAIAAEVPRIVAPVLGKRGFGEAQLIAEWAAIMGPDLAGQVSPDKLSFRNGERREGTLRLRVAPAAAPLVQHREPQIVERVNTFFGYRAVARLALVQGPPAREPEPPPPRPRPLAAPERQSLDRRLAVIEDPDLRDALRRLGEAVIGTGGG